MEATAGVELREIDLNEDESSTKQQATAAAVSSGTARTSRPSISVSSPPAIGRQGGDDQQQQQQRVRPPDGMRPPDASDNDVNAYNVICKMDSLAFGPGWFNDIFDVQVQLTSTLQTADSLALNLVARHAFQRHVALLDAAQPITGTVTMRAPQNKAVWMSQLKVSLEEHLLMLDGEGSEVVGAVSTDVCTVGRYIENAVTFPFELHPECLVRGSNALGAREGYIGDMIALRHQLVIAAQRPWYTFDVVTHVPVILQAINIPQALNGSPSNALPGAQGPLNEEGGPNTTMIIPDCGGRCEFEFDSDTLDCVAGVLRGSVVFLSLVKTIVAAHVVILRAELVGGSVYESVIGEHTILGEPRPDPSATSFITQQQQQQQSTAAAPTDESDSGSQTGPIVFDDILASPYVENRHVGAVVSSEPDCPSEPVIGTGRLGVTLPLAQLPLTPTMPWLRGHASTGATGQGSDSGHEDVSDSDDEDGRTVAGVRYFVRLILEESVDESSATVAAAAAAAAANDANDASETISGGSGKGSVKTYWNTHEIYLYRSRLRSSLEEHDPEYSYNNAAVTAAARNAHTSQQQQHGSSAYTLNSAAHNNNSSNNNNDLSDDDSYKYGTGSDAVSDVESDVASRELEDRDEGSADQSAEQSEEQSEEQDQLQEEEVEVQAAKLEVSSTATS